MKELRAVEKSEIKDFSHKTKGVFFSRKQLCIPYAVFLLFFVVFPLLLIIYYAFTAINGEFTFENIKCFFVDPDTLEFPSATLICLFNSMLLGLITTALCLVIGYPVAYILSRIKSHRRTILLLLFIMPMWINFVLRAMAMKELLSLIGIYGNNDYLSVVIGMVYDYLPFMILPLYTTLIKMDKSLEEAALDLGANKFEVFTKVTLPLSTAGIVSGISMVFLPSMTCYVISETFSYGNVKIIGKFIEDSFITGSDWNKGSAIALILLVIMFLCTILTGGFSKEENVRGTTL